MSEQTTPKPWYKKWWGIILAILFFPFVVPYLVWTKTTWNKWVKIAITAVCAIIVIFSMIDSSQNNQSKIEQEQTSNTNTNSTVVPEQNAVQKLTEEEKIRALVQDVLKGKNNMGLQYVKKINVVKQANGGWGVFTEFNADDNLTTNLRKGSIESKMAEIYMALYISNYDVRAASVSAYLPLVDKYGNESSGVVYKSILDKTEADKVNWNANKASLKVSILPSVWTISILHTEFR